MQSIPLLPMKGAQLFNRDTVKRKKGNGSQKRVRKTERNRDTIRKRAASATAKDVYIEPAPATNKRRRKRLEKNDAKWLMYYFGVKSNSHNPFWYKFTSQQLQMIEAIGHAARWGGDQSLAASRGEGKTTFFERLLTKYALEGRIKFGVLCAATGTAAANSLEAIRDSLETNDLLYDDYREVCWPVRALENTPNRAHYQTVSGKRFDNRKPFSHEPSRFSWCGQSVVFPEVPGSPSAGAIIATRGLDAAVRGLKRKGRRPDIVGIDDPDTEESARSEEQAKKLEDRIDKALGGLGGQQRGIARVMLTTLQNRICVSYRFTDPEQKPSWKGKRYRFRIKPPDMPDLWDEYISIWQGCIQELSKDGKCLDPFARKAHDFYLANRKSMDVGAVVANPNRFNPEKLPDGSQLEVSALQRYYNEVARIGPEAVAAEYDNNPPEESGPIESGITAHRVQRQVSGYSRRLVPPEVACVVQGIDVGKFACHFVVKAFRTDATAFVIDYGVQEVLGTIRGSDEALDKHILRALYARRETVLENPYAKADGEIVEVQKTIVDAGYRTDAVYHFCREAGIAYQAAMGFGKSSGCAKTSFNGPVRVTADKRPGDGWFLTARPQGVWLCGMDTDRWKGWEHDRWMTPADLPGTCLLFGERGIGDRLSDDQKHHFSFSKHITAEVESEDPTKNKGMVRKWKVKSDTNHYLDASYMADVAANMCGITLLRQSRLIGGARKSAQELADIARKAK